MDSKILRVDPEGNPRAHLVKAAEIVRRGGVIAYPTDTFYGLGANPFNEEAIKRIFKIKGREETKPLLLLIAYRKEVKDLTRVVKPIAKQLMRHYWPGPLTMIFEASASLPPLLLGNSGKVGLRLPNNKLVSRLIRLVGYPLTASSANKSGKRNPLSAADVLNSLGDEIELILDGGPSSTALPSTVIDVSLFPPLLIREGVISFSEVLSVL